MRSRSGLRRTGTGITRGATLVEWLAAAKDGDLWRINAFAVAGQLTVDRFRLLATLIRFVREGVLDLNWDFHCTECNAVAGSHRHLQEATAGNHCPCATWTSATTSRRTWK